MAKKIGPENYNFLRDCYTGKGGFADGSYLIQHPRESDEKYTRRKEASSYSNFPRKIVDSFVSHVFRHAPQREFKLEVYQKFVNNCDGRGTRLDVYLKRATRLSMLLGTVFLIVDRPAEKAETKAEEQERGLFPYLVTRTPDQINDAGTVIDDDGALVSISFKEKDGEDDVFRTYTAEGWVLSRDDSGEDIINSGEYDLGGRVPVVALHSTDPLENTDLIATPWVWDVATLSWRLFNRESELDEIFRAQTFSVLTLPVKDVRDIEAYKDFDLSTENALPYNAETAGQPNFIAPPDGPAKLYMERIDKLVRAMYALANLEFATGVQPGMATSSGVAMSYRFQEANRTLAELASRVEAAEMAIADLVAAWSGQDFAGEISYPRDFDVIDLQHELKIGMDALTLGISRKFDAELKKRLARQLLGEGISDETLAEIDAEVNAADVYDDQVDRAVDDE